MPGFRVTLAYDGTEFCGWQRQAAGVSVQGVLEDALREFTDRPVTVFGAGRTDAGVHARGQVASFVLDYAIDPPTLSRALNAKLPDAVRVLDAAAVPDGFHARFDARAKTYEYRIWNGAVLSPFERRYAWHVVDALDVSAMDDAARRLEGRHDFAAFKVGTDETPSTVRELFSSRVTIETEAPAVPAAGRCRVLCVRVTGSGFLRHMVRSIAGSLVEVGRGRRRPDWMQEVLAARDRTRAGLTAPACGLFLVSVEYGGVE